MYSKRRYKVAICDVTGIVEKTVTVDELMEVPSNNDNLPEYEYAMKDIADMVLDLRVHESIYFQPNRDDKASKGIIYRMS
jgi:hypothetical protein